MSDDDEWARNGIDPPPAGIDEKLAELMKADSIAIRRGFWLLALTIALAAGILWMIFHN